MEKIEQRESDIQELCNAILNMSPRFYDNPNGGYENDCPFCYNTAYGYNKNPYRNMSEIKHAQDCPYLIAKDLSAGLTPPSQGDKTEMR